jgi:uncharacterized membrane protein
MEKKKITREQSKDTGIVSALLLLFLGTAGESFFLIKLSILIIFISFLMPGVFHYPAMLWFGFSGIIGSVVSRIVLAVIFVLLVIPVGLIRKVMKKNSMMIGDFRKSPASSWTLREHKYSESDTLKPY